MFRKRRLVRVLAFHRIVDVAQFGDVVSVDRLGAVVTIDSGSSRSPWQRLAAARGWGCDHRGRTGTRFRPVPHGTPFAPLLSRSGLADSAIMPGQFCDAGPSALPVSIR